MLIKAYFPSFYDLSLLIPDIFVKRCNARKISVKKLLTDEAVCSILRISKEKLFRILIKSKVMHGVELKNESILIHPDGAYKYITNYYRSYIKKTEV